MVMDFRAVNERICSLRLRASIFINCHAPMEGKESIVKEDFYGNLERIYETAHRHDIKITLGDFNARIGKETGYRATVGRNTNHEISSGRRLINFAMEKI